MILKSADNPGKSSICSKVKGEVLPEKCIRNFVKGSWHFQSASNRFRLVYCERVRSVPGDGGRRTLLMMCCSGENGPFLAGDGGWHHGGRRRWWVTQCGKRLWRGGQRSEWDWRAKPALISQQHKSHSDWIISHRIFDNSLDCMLWILIVIH